MKVFKIPEIEIIRLSESDVIATSSTRCDDCGICPPGKDECRCYDFPGSDQ